jgi:hypothetical protein
MHTGSANSIASNSNAIDGTSILGKAKAARQCQGNDGPETSGNRHSHDTLRGWYEERDELNDKGPVAGRRQRQTIQIGSATQEFPQSQFHAGLHVAATNNN